MIDTYLVGYASGIGGRDVSTGMAPLVIETAIAEHANFNYKWLSNIYPATTAAQLEAIGLLLKWRSTDWLCIYVPAHGLVLKRPCFRLVPGKGHKKHFKTKKLACYGSMPISMHTHRKQRWQRPWYACCGLIRRGFTRSHAVIWS